MLISGILFSGLEHGVMIGTEGSGIDEIPTVCRGTEPQIGVSTDFSIP